MNNWNIYLIAQTATVRQALEQLDRLGKVGSVLFVTDLDLRLLGSVTDGDIRRGFLKGLGMEASVMPFLHSPCKSVREGGTSTSELSALRDTHIRFVPQINAKGQVTDILDLETTPTLPVEVILMAGGKGRRLMPLTAEIPKPLLPIGSKPILEHNLDRLARFGISDVHLAIHYKGDLIREYFGDGSSRNLRIRYVEEKEPLGTIGAVSQIGELKGENVLIMNADLLTNIDFADFYAAFTASGADMCVASTKYQVDVPYAILESGADNLVTALTEKPTYTYYSNAGIYLVRRSFLELVPSGTYFDITDLMEKGLKEGRRIIHYPILGYWLDIGKLQDYEKAQQDIKHLQL